MRHEHSSAAVPLQAESIQSIPACPSNPPTLFALNHSHDTAINLLNRFGFTIRSDEHQAAVAA